MAKGILRPPLTDEVVQSLETGQEVLITGEIYTARDAAHKRFCECLVRGEMPPVDLQGQIIYYTGPTPPVPGHAVGSAGPTTSYRMDDYTPRLIRECGLKGMIGKGPRGVEVITAMEEKKAVYLAAIGGAGALIARSIKKAEIVCYEDLGPEAVRWLEVEELPCIVAIDCHGGNLYKSGPKRYQKLKGGKYDD